jgi:hypothetical protein
MEDIVMSHPFLTPTTSSTAGSTANRNRLTDTDTLVVLTRIVQTSDRSPCVGPLDTRAVTDAGNGFAGHVLEATRGALGAC